MLVDRIIGAFTFRKGIYAEIEKDTTFTTTAWILVAVVAFLNQLGSQANSNLLNWLLGAVVGTVFAVIAFAVGALVINWVGLVVIMLIAGAILGLLGLGAAAGGLLGF
jgi:hypothetical protein